MSNQVNERKTYSSLRGFHRAVPIILYAVAAFTLFCILLPDMGVVGNAIRTVLTGLFSYGAYAVPLLLVLHGIFYPSDIDEDRILSRVIFSFITVIAISSLSYAITNWSADVTFNVREYFVDGTSISGGGFIGGVVGFCLIKAFSKVGLVIITTAVFAIYISYFFARGQRNITKVLIGILRAIVTVLAFIEMGIKKLFGRVKNAKNEKQKRTAEQKNLELTDDEFFAVDNGMQKLEISELGIKETRTKESEEANPTLQSKIHHKSSVSEEEAFEMEMRERREEFYSQGFTVVNEHEREREPRRIINVDYGDSDSEPTREASKNDIIIEPEDTMPEPEPAPARILDDAADSVFTKDFDPFSLLKAEEMASKPSSHSLLAEKKPTKAHTVTEDISELTPEDVERIKRVKEFEERKAAIVGRRAAAPATASGEFEGEKKSIDFREDSVENVDRTPREEPEVSLKLDKSEQPKEDMSIYTRLGFGDEDYLFPKKNDSLAFTAPATIYSHEEPEEFEEATTIIITKPRTAEYTEPKAAYTSPEIHETVIHSYEEPRVSAAPVFTAPAPEETSIPVFKSETPEPILPREEPRAAYEYETIAPVFEEARPEPIAPVFEAPAAPMFTEAPKAEPVTSEPIQTEAYPKAPVIAEAAETEESPKEEPTYSLNVSSNHGNESADEFVPEFKSYTAPTEDTAKKNDGLVFDFNGREQATESTLTVERTMINDETDFAEEEYDSFNEDGPIDSFDNEGAIDSFTDEPEDGEDEIYDGEEPDEDDGWNTEEIPPEERNPVVDGYRDMFPSLREDDPVIPDGDEDEDDVIPGANDYRLISPDERDDGYEEVGDDTDDDSDEPPFDEPTAVPAKAASKPEEKPKEKKKPNYKHFKMPPIELLGLEPNMDDDTSEIQENTKILIDTLASFNVTASIKGVDRGPRITRYEVVPAKGVKVQSITNLFNDLSLALAKEGIRMEAPIPGKSAIGFEIPNKRPRNVRLRELIECEEFQEASSKTFVCIGKDVAGMPVFADIAKFPHALVAGATGMGKSVCINSIMISMLYKAKPDEVRFIMIDPKKVEFNMYSGIPHLLIPVITDSKQAAGALMWAVEEMERRFDLIEKFGVRTLAAYNDAVGEDPSLGEKLPKIVIVIDELNDLMMQVRDPVEDLIMRLAQKARAAGLHIIIGTQRPDVKVITGTIKANIPTRISCKVSSVVDSRTILEMAGAEKLLDKGDMLFKAIDKPKPLRVQGAFVSDNEVQSIMKYLKEQVDEDVYDDSIFEEVNRAAMKCGNKKNGGGASQDDFSDGGGSVGYYNDQVFLDAVELAIRSGKISTSLLQRKFSIGYGKAAKYIDAMEEIGVVSEPQGQKPRDVLISMDEWHEKLSRVDIY